MKFLAIFLLLSSFTNAQQIPVEVDCFDRSFIESFQLQSENFDSIKVKLYTPGGLAQNKSMRERLYVFNNHQLSKIIERDIYESGYKYCFEFQYDQLGRLVYKEYRRMQSGEEIVSKLYYKYAINNTSPDTLIRSGQGINENLGWSELSYKDENGRVAKSIRKYHGSDTLTTMYSYQGDTTTISTTGKNFNIMAEIVWHESHKPKITRYSTDQFDFVWNNRECSIFLTELDIGTRYLMERAYLNKYGLPYQMETYRPSGEMEMTYLYEYFPPIKDGGGLLKAKCKGKNQRKKLNR